jgi:hypothetical protein
MPFKSTSNSAARGILLIDQKWRNVVLHYLSEVFDTGYYSDRDFVSIPRDLGELVLAPALYTGARTPNWSEADMSMHAQLGRRFFHEPQFDVWLAVLSLFLNCVERREWAAQSDFFGRLNKDLQKHGFAFGYRPISVAGTPGQFFPMQSDYVFESITRPMLEMLGHADFAAARTEFEKAVSFFLEGPDRYSDCVTNAVKAFESVMKVVLEKRGALPDPTLPAAKLVKAIVDEGVIDASFTAQAEATTALLNQLKNIATSGAVLVRNRVGAHGAGTRTAPPEKLFVEFTLHQVAALVLLIGRSAGYN